MSGGEDAAPGWEAIDAAIAPLVGEVVPSHFGTGTGLPDQDGLWGVSAYDLGRHWFLVTYGLSELFSKVSDDPAVSGWGTELTMRVSRGPEVPGWAVSLLLSLGALVFQRSDPFLPDDRLAVPKATPPTPSALCWATDADLRPIHTVHGSVQFVQTVGITDDELAAMRDRSTAAVLDELRLQWPDLAWPRPAAS